MLPFNLTLCLHCTFLLSLGAVRATRAIWSHVTAAYYNAPNAGNPKQPGLNRHKIVGRITGNCFKLLCNGCSCNTGTCLYRSFDGLPADDLGCVEFDHMDDNKTGEPCHIFRRKLTPELINELKTCRLLFAVCHRRLGAPATTNRELRLQGLQRRSSEVMVNSRASAPSAAPPATTTWPHAQLRTLLEVLQSDQGKCIVALHDRVYGQGKDPKVPYENYRRQIEEIMKAPVSDG